MTEILSILQSRIDASKPVLPAKQAWLQLVHEERRRIDETQDLVDAVRRYVVFMHGWSREDLADFGIVPKQRRALTSAEKAESALKAKATRVARHTMGRRQKEKITGSAPGIDVAPSGVT